MPGPIQYRTQLEILQAQSFQLQLRKGNPSHIPNAHRRKFFNLGTNLSMGSKKNHWNPFNKSLWSSQCVPYTSCCKDQRPQVSSLNSGYLWADRQTHVHGLQTCSEVQPCVLSPPKTTSDQRSHQGRKGLGRVIAFGYNDHRRPMKERTLELDLEFRDEAHVGR